MSNPIAKISIENLGEMEFELFLDTPQSTANFISLAKEGFYDGLNFHRIIPGFVAQGGCPDGTGMGGPGYNIVGEFANNRFDNPHLHNRGVLSWARSQARDSAGSQFFITLAPTPFLDGEYAVFGEIISGEELLDVLASHGSESGEVDTQLVIKSITIEDNGSELEKLIKL